MAADGALGDPRRAHPVAAFGRVAGTVERRLYRDSRLAGAGYTALLTGAAVLLGVSAQRLGRRSPVLEATTTAVATWAVLGGTSLANEGIAMGRALDAGDLARARERLPNLCGRDPNELENRGRARAAV